MRVDLPAPFSPTRACISPGPRSKLMLLRARVPGKLFPIFTMPTSGIFWSGDSLSLWAVAVIGSVGNRSGGRPLGLGHIPVNILNFQKAVLNYGLGQIVLVYDNRLQPNGGHIF